jgi:hypothetical protein
MVPHPAVGIHTTEARTGVLAFSVDARSVCGAVCIDQTLRSAIGWASNHLRQAGALTAVSNLPRRIAVWTTRVGVTGIICHHRFNWYRFPPACSERIPNITLNTGARGNVVEDTTNCIHPTSARAGVHTVELLACFVRGTI